ncbi:MAG: extracellular solute-binding protein [Spirochaetales bacterium]|nr:extracellular solute-binding protein [Spirochaetales bacterium]
MKLAKRVVVLSLVAVLAMGLVFAGGDKEKGKVRIVTTSWRTEDVERMNRINALYMEKHPNVIIDFQPTADEEYDANTTASLETGIGADIIYLRSYDEGLPYYEAGHLVDLTDIIPNLDKFPSAAVGAWSKDGVTYGLPSAGVTHGVYYNKAIFKKHGLTPPKTWAEFIKLNETLLAKGEVPIAQGALDDWTLYEVAFSGLGANFYGGEAARQALLAGKAKLTDPNFVKAFEAVYSLKKYLPRGYEALDYSAMLQMFASGQAAMFIGGSWEISTFEDMGADPANVGWFAPPVEKAGDRLQYCFHVDIGVGVNKNSKHLDEAIEYLKWVAGAEYAQALMNELPGFFSYTPADVKINDPLAAAMFEVIADSDPTVRTVWEKLSAQAPSGNELMGIALPGMMVDKYTPKEAAEFVQSQLETWYPPFRK